MNVQRPYIFIDRDRTRLIEKLNKFADYVETHPNCNIFILNITYQDQHWTATITYKCPQDKKQAFLTKAKEIENE